MNKEQKVEVINDFIGFHTEMWEITPGEETKLRTSATKYIEEVLEVVKCKGNCGANYCDENGCTDQKEKVKANGIEKSTVEDIFMNPNYDILN